MTELDQQSSEITGHNPGAFPSQEQHQHRPVCHTKHTAERVAPWNLDTMHNPFQM